MTFDDISRKVPHLVRWFQRTPTTWKNSTTQAALPAIMKELKQFLHLDRHDSSTKTVTVKNIQNSQVTDS
jgi:dihydroxyacid dehydratase/phosphogluconate dehydratase